MPPARPAAQVLLDFGLAEELTPRVRKHFLSFLHAIGAGNGAAGARHMLAFGVVQARILFMTQGLGVSNPHRYHPVVFARL